MPNIYSNIINFNSNSTKKIIKILSKNGIIGLPTETVYGLAANAYSETAIKKVYSTKKRIKRNPLIIHYYDLNRAKKDVILDNKFYKLYKKFSPGPITYIVKKKRILKLNLLHVQILKLLELGFQKIKL